MKRLKTANPSNPVDMRNPQVRRGLFSEGKVAAVIDGHGLIRDITNSKINFGVVPPYLLLKENSHVRFLRFAWRSSLLIVNRLRRHNFSLTISHLMKC
jgi:hypothetical protein